MDISNPHDRDIRTQSRPHWRSLAVLAALSVFAQFVSVELWVESSRAQLLWLPGALLLCALLSLPWRHWPSTLLVVWLGAVLGTAMLSTTSPSVLVTLAGQLLMVVPAAYVLGIARTGTRGAMLESYRWIGLFVLLAAIALPALGASWVELVSRRLGDDGHPGGWYNVALAQSASYVLLVPAYLGLRHAARGAARLRLRWQNVLLIAGTAAAFALACWVPFNEAPLVRPFLLLLAFTLQVWSLLLFGAAGAFTALLTLSLICMQASNVGALPFSGDGGYEAILTIQVCSIAMALALLSLTAVSEQRATLRLALTNAYARLSDLTGRMLLVQEEERARIARDLHDDINQSVAAISIQISALKKELESAPRDRLADIQAQLLDVSGDIRRLSHDLHPSILRYTSLAASLVALCEAHTGSSGLEVVCAIHEDMALTNDQKLNLFRIAQEAIHNVETHAQASAARMSLSREGEDVVLRVDDNGIGIPEDMRQRVGSGLGMISMEERARSLGGHFQMVRLVQGGSRLEVRLPLSRTDERTPASDAEPEVLLSPDR